MKKQIVISTLGVLLVGSVAFYVGLKSHVHPEYQKPGKFPEQVVYVRSADDVVDGGILFTAPTQVSKSLAIIWVHGWGANFYTPSYVGIGRSLAEHGFPTVSVNTRMHDIGTTEKNTLMGKRVRGGGYWGVTSEDAKDIAAWIDYVQQLGYDRVVLVGHSAGWSSVARYQADTQDTRVVGLVLGSPGVGYSPQPDDQQLHAQAKKLVDEGNGEELIVYHANPFPHMSARQHSWI